MSDLAASERFYRTVLESLGLEPSHADAELVEWDDWDIGRPYPPRASRDPRAAHRVPGRHAGGGATRSGRPASTRGSATTARPVRGPSTARTTTVASCATPTATVPRRSTASARTPCSRGGSTTCGSASPTSPPRSASTPRSRRTPGSGWATTRPSGSSSPARTARSRSSTTGGHSPSTSTWRSGRREDATVRRVPRAPRWPRATGPRGARRATGLPPRLLRRVRARPGRPQRGGRQPQPDGRPISDESAHHVSAEGLAALEAELNELEPKPPRDRRADPHLGGENEAGDPVFVVVAGVDARDRVVLPVGTDTSGSLDSSVTRRCSPARSSQTKSKNTGPKS